MGPNVKIFDPSMSTGQIKATVDAIANQQVSIDHVVNDFGPPSNANTVPVDVVSYP